MNVCSWSIAKCLATSLAWAFACQTVRDWEEKIGCESVSRHVSQKGVEAFGGQAKIYIDNKMVYKQNLGDGSIYNL